MFAPQKALNLATALLLSTIVSTIAFADSSSISTVNNHTVECHSSSGSSVGSSNDRWTIKINSQEIVIDQGKLSWGNNQSKALPQDWKRIVIDDAGGKTSIKVDGEDFAEIKNDK